MNLQTSSRIAVFMPATDIALAERASLVLRDRSGIPADFYLHDDVDRLGFVYVVNDLFSKTEHRYVVYLAQDAYPGINCFKSAFDAMETSGAGLLAFNDGKRYGRLTAFCMVRRAWAENNYNVRSLFYRGYHSHFADVGLSDLARREKSFIYNPNAVLVEVDYNKRMK